MQWIRARDAQAFEAKLEAATSTPDIDAQRFRKLKAEADMVEMARDLKHGEFVPAEDVEARWSQIAVSVREAVMSVPGVAVQSGLIEPGQEAALETVCRDALSGLVNDSAAAAA